MPTVSLKLRGAVSCTRHGSHSFYIFEMVSLTLFYMFSPEARLSSPSVARSEGCPKDLCIVLSSVSVYREYGKSLVSQLWIRK